MTKNGNLTTLTSCFFLTGFHENSAEGLQEWLNLRLKSISWLNFPLNAHLSRRNPLPCPLKTALAGVASHARRGYMGSELQLHRIQPRVRDSLTDIANMQTYMQNSL